MIRLNEYLKSFSTESIKETMVKTPYDLNKFGYNFDSNCKIDIIQFKPIQYDQKYIGDLSGYFRFSIKREFYIKAIVKNESKKESKLFEETLVCEGRALLKNWGNGEVESYQDSVFQTVGLTFCKPSDSVVKINNDMIDFEEKDFPYNILLHSEF